MITRLQLLRNIGRFDSVTGGPTHNLTQVSLVYAENGHGKSTISAILRSLGSGHQDPILERRRLNAQHPPHVVIECTGLPAPVAIFQNGTWTHTNPNIVVFDDQFVEQNVSSGLVVSPGHRQNLHNLILGAQGVTLNNQLQGHIETVQRYTGVIRDHGALIEREVGGGANIDAFCALPMDPDVDQKIEETTSELARSSEQDPIRNTPALEPVNLPDLNLDAIKVLLETDLPDLESAAASAVHVQISSIGDNGEHWVAAGMRYQTGRPGGLEGECPFCAQDLSQSRIISHYRAFFGEQYAALKDRINQTLTEVNGVHGENAVLGFQQAVATLTARCTFWSRFCDSSAITLDAAAVVSVWQYVRNQLVEMLQRKQSAPLEKITVPDSWVQQVDEYLRMRHETVRVNEAILPINAHIHAFKTEVQQSNPATLRERLARLQNIKRRHMAPLVQLCQQYLTEKAAKVAEETARDATRAQLDQYRTTVFTQYEHAINRYLTRFNAGYRLAAVSPVNRAAGSSCTYELQINNRMIPVAAALQPEGQPSFKSALSAGDRNTLALAFFFSSLELDPDLSNKIVVIDDPVSSLDDHRSSATIEEICRLAGTVRQVIVLSHSKLFLNKTWKELRPQPGVGTALKLTRLGVDGSDVEVWDIEQDMLPAHYWRFAALKEYLVRGQDDANTARSLRLHIEHFLKAAYPGPFTGKLIGEFCRECRSQVNTPGQILNATDLQELEELNRYTREFHHDSATGGQVAVPNATELLGYVRRVLAFTQK